MTRGIFIGLGSNLGDRRANLEQAMELLPVSVSLKSSIYETEPVEFTEQPWFLNAVIGIATESGPMELLDLCRLVELKLGRMREIPKGPRTIDLDILFYHDTILMTPDLTIPHPAIAGRRFVLEPLREVAPEFVHPVLGLSVAELLNRCPDHSVVRKTS